MRRHAVYVLLAPAVVAAGLLAAAAPAQEGQSEVYERVDLHFTAKAPGARTGFLWRVAQRALAAGEQPPPVRRARLRFPKGTRFDTGAVPRCTATDEAITEGGAAACSPRSRLGGGTGTVFIGSPDHLPVVVDAFNARGGAILLLTTETGDVLRVLRGSIDGPVIDATLPRVPLPTGGEAALTSLTVRLRAAGTRRRPWVRTPPKCPRSGSWRFVYDIRYDDPPGRQTPFSLSACRR